MMHSTHFIYGYMESILIRAFTVIILVLIPLFHDTTRDSQDVDFELSSYVLRDVPFQET